MDSIMNGPDTPTPSGLPPTAANSRFVTRPLPTFPPDPETENDFNAGPSWGLIIPIIMIVAFLLCVAICLYWHKWRDKRTLHIQRPRTPNSSSFHRSFLGPNVSLTRGQGTIRDSTRSTTPLRSSLNEKISNTKVTPIHANPSNKFTYNWDKNQWKSYSLPATSTSARRLSGRPLSPIDEIDSPISHDDGLSEFSNTYDVNPQASFSPYHLTWISRSRSNRPPSYELATGNSSLSNWSRRRSAPPTGEDDPFQGFEPANTSPFFPNNNTPTEGDHHESDDDTPTNPSSHFTSYPSSPGRSTTTTERNSSSMGTSVPESVTLSNQLSARQDEFIQATWDSALENPSVKSLPSSIMKYHQTVVDDNNNNSIVVPGQYPPNPSTKGINYTLASSITSSDTNYSDNTSMLPNVGSNNTTGYPYHTRPYPIGTEQCSNVSPEDLSKLVEEMSSIRPVDDMSSIRPNSSAERITSISGTHNASVNLHRSWSVVAEIDISSLSSKGTSSRRDSQTGYSWDNYPLNSKQTSSSPDIPLHVRSGIENPLSESTLQNMKFQKPILCDKQYWV